jgi:hypothetical protein
MGAAGNVTCILTSQCAISHFPFHVRLLVTLKSYLMLPPARKSEASSVFHKPDIPIRFTKKMKYTQIAESLTL